MKLHEKIKHLRKEQGWSQGEMSEKLGIHGGHVSRLENGKYQPSVEVLKKLANVFEVSVDYLLNESEELEEIQIEDQTLAEKFRLLNALDGKDKEMIIHMINAILTKRKMVDVLSQELEIH